MFKKSILFKGMSLALVAVVATSTHAVDRVMEEVVVTATKRQQTLQEVPVAVSVTSGETIERARILDIIDLQSVVPSLRVPQFQSSTQVNFVIRGFGNGANNAGIEPSVGVFIDGVYRSRSAAQIADLTNLERIEVLRGPQNTLFGKNASAGVISVVTRSPEFEWNSNVEVSAGNYGAIQTKGYVTGPLSENAAFSVGGSYNERDGYTDNLTLGTEVNDRDRWSLNGQYLFEPNDNMQFKLSIDYSEIDEICCTAANVVSGPTAALIPLLGGQLDNENPFSYDIFYNNDPRETVDNGGVSLHTDFEFDNFSFTSITAYRELDRANLSDDVDFSGADIIAPQSNIASNFETFTQEFRVTSNGDGSVHWLAGLYYFDEQVKQQGGISFGPRFREYADFLTGAPGTLSFVEGLFGIPTGTFHQEGTGVTESATQDDEAYSLFGTVDWEVTDRIVLTLGLNYTNDKKEVSLSQVNTDVFSKLAFPPSLAGLSGIQFLPELLNFPNVGENGKSDDSNTDYTVRVAYEVNDNLNAYASWATGFKATSWNLSRDSRPTPTELAAVTAAGLALPNNLVAGTRFAAPEEAEVFEIGLKGQYDKFSFAVTIFDQTLNDFQTNAFTGAGFTLTNAGETNVKGLEIETTYFATNNLTLTFAGTFLDPVYESYPLAAAGDLSGENVAGIAEESISISGNWDWESGEYTGFVRADYQYESEVQILDSPVSTAALATVGSSTRKSNLLSASIGVSRGNYDLSLWGRNLTSNEFLISAFPSVAQPGSFSGYPNQPKTYGLTLRAHFN
jgi:iron complex outermembrane receptor protein